MRTGEKGGQPVDHNGIGLALLALLGQGRLAAAQTMGPLDVIHALVAAENRNDPAGMRALIAPDAPFVQDAGMPGRGTQGRAGFIRDNTGANNNHVVLANLALTAPDTVTGDAMLGGGGIPKLPHPFTLHFTFKVAGGQATNGEFVTSPQSAQDLAALGPPPGMPATGAPAPLLPRALLLWGLLLAWPGRSPGAGGAHRASRRGRRPVGATPFPG